MSAEQDAARIREVADALEKRFGGKSSAAPTDDEEILRLAAGDPPPTDDDDEINRLLRLAGRTTTH